MTRVIYVDCVAGVAGDMLLGALIDAGAPVERVRDAIRSLGVGGLELALERVERHGVGAARVIVTAAPEANHRRLRDVREILDRASLGERAAAIAANAFERLATAEGHIHGVGADEVHFHEVGAADALADICGVAVALDCLAPARVVCSPLPQPRGFVGAAHGRLPLPAPATLELLRGAPVYGVDVEHELVTPTGAALVAAAADSYGPMPALTLERVGYGAGRRDLDEIPNLVRVVVGSARAGNTGEAVLIETNLDDLSPELVPDAAEACSTAGALDVWVTAAQMKRGRPGVVISALARPADRAAVCEAMLRSTSTLGVRVTCVGRWELERTFSEVVVGDHRLRVKLGWLDGEVVNFAPEHADVERVAKATGRPSKAVWADAFRAFEGTDGRS